MFTALLALTAAIAVAEPPAPPAPPEPDAPKPLNVLVITGGGYHDFERNTNALLEGLRSKGRFDLTVLHLGSSSPQYREGATEFDGGDLFASYDAILAYHQGDLGFTDSTKAALLAYVRGGGGYIGIHSAADSHPGWDEYDNMLGGRFESHPPFGEIKVRVDVTEHEITRGVAREWTLKDEFYHLKNYKDDDKLVLMTGRSPGDAPGEGAPPRPVSWEKNYGAGRVFYTILGHGIETHSNERFHQLIANAIAWSAKAPKPNERGEYILFDGTSKDGWSMAGPGGFRLEDGELVAHGGMGMLWYHERRFRDFTLTLEWKTSKITDNSGVFVRFHKPSNDPWYAVQHGHEIQIQDDPNAGATRGTGSIYAFAEPQRGASRPPGEWNLYEITLKGDTYTVVLNGRKILEWDSPSERHGREGYIGLQNHDDHSPVRFRNIRVKVLE